MTKTDFEFDEDAANFHLQDEYSVGAGNYKDVGGGYGNFFIDGARYQHKLDLEKHEAFVVELKCEQVKNIKLMLNKSQELNEKHLKEIATLKEQNAILIEALKNIYADGSYKDIASEVAIEALKKVGVES